jgi:transcriptional regulator with GAF, ATPase, and Fis domain
VNAGPDEELVTAVRALGPLGCSGSRSTVVCESRNDSRNSVVSCPIDVAPGASHRRCAVYGRPLELADALTEAAEVINKNNSLEETLDAIVHATRTSVPGFTDVGISITHPDGKIETMSGTGELVWELDTIQYDLGEGPCVDSVKQGETVVVENARHEQRWPNFIPQAVQRGLRSQLAVRLYNDGKTMGGLNLYSTASDEIDPEAVHAAKLFATHASIALGHAQHEQQLSQALSSRRMIGQAIGILMERYKIDQDRAFQFLIRASSTSNIKLRDVAQELVNTTDNGYRHS